MWFLVGIIVGITGGLLIAFGNTRVEDGCCKTGLALGVSGWLLLLWLIGAWSLLSPFTWLLAVPFAWHWGREAERRFREQECEARNGPN